MQLARYEDEEGLPSVGVVENDRLRPLVRSIDGRRVTLASLLEEDDPQESARDQIDQTTPARDLASIRILAPIDHQEVWGAGVTYLRSKVARQEESEQGGSFYDQVYTADRPELFFKATAHRVSGPAAPVRVRADSQWSVPEPELAVVLNSSMKLVGFTIGNDMSARDVEGRNPLYLPQAKVYDACCGLGPWITLAPAMPAWNALAIVLKIERAGQAVFEGSTSTSQIVRTLDELISWLGRDHHFPEGVILLTGTGIVPPDEFTLKDGDTVSISIDGVGTLVNPVVQS